jgi:murein DD-endopeptidase MepM/ murein hydrolase activator NlpD
MKRSWQMYAWSMFAMAFTTVVSMTVVNAYASRVHQFTYPFESVNAPSTVEPMNRSYTPHYGVDYAARYGTKVYAAISGTVLAPVVDDVLLNTQNPAAMPGNGQCEGLGNYIKIRNENLGCTVIYAHLDPGSILFQQGNEVVQGDLIAETANTGYAVRKIDGVWKCGEDIGYHLHFEVQCDEVTGSGTVTRSYNPYNGLDYVSDSALWSSYKANCHQTYCSEFTDETSWAYSKCMSDNHCLSDLDYATHLPLDEDQWDDSFFVISANDTYIFPNPNGGVSDFDYDESDFKRCSTTVYGGEETDWDYECGVKSGNSYDYGETFRALYEITDIFVDHRFVAEFSNEGGRILQSDTTDWNYVNGYWEKAYFWPVLYDADYGEWQFRFYVRTTENMNYVLLRTINFCSSLKSLLPASYDSPFKPQNNRQYFLPVVIF